VGEHFLRNFLSRGGREIEFWTLLGLSVEVLRAANCAALRMTSFILLRAANKLKVKYQSEMCSALDERTKVD
jgi:hypothetical protein